MVGFLEDKKVYGDDFNKEDVTHTCFLMYDLVTGFADALMKAEQEAIANIAKSFDGKGTIDASNPDQVDLAGGPKAIDNQTGFNFKEDS